MQIFVKKMCQIYSYYLQWYYLSIHLWVAKMSANCCNNTLTVLQSVPSTSCDAACGITCTSIGMLENKSCAFCSNKLVHDETCKHRFDPSTIVTPVKPTNNYCQGRACNMCNNGNLQSVPEGAVIYVTSACSMHTNVQNDTVTIHNPQPSAIASMTLVLYVNVILSGFPLTTTSNLNIITYTNAFMHINMSGPAVDNDLCAFTVTGHPHNNYVDVQLKVDMTMISNQECLLGIFSNKRQTNLIANNPITIQNINPNNTKFYAAAVANVQGSITVPSNYKVLYMETNHGKFTVSNGKGISVSNLLSIFGTLYEIEYFDPDGRSSIEPRMPWLTHANKILTLVAAIAGGALLNT